MSRPLAPAIMVQGCTSSAGKSYLAAALCRMFSNQGLRVAPFKAQNMSNNAGVTPAGLEMGRAQLVQAQAARVVPDVRMNPVLLKPEGQMRSQVVLLGQANPELTALPWRERKPRLWPHVQAALRSLQAEYDLLIIEGAGSPAEINLRSGDIVNMRVAHAAGARVLLAADIDRGGAFAHLLGTWHCLDEADKARLGGFVLNKFRGDPALLAPAPQWLEAQTGVPTLGVVPWLDIPLPEEDSANLDGVNLPGNPFGAVGVIRLPHIANTDEFAPLGGHLRWVGGPAELGGVKAIILPGSKNTAADLAWLRQVGLDRAITALAGQGTLLLGICGGLQMLGQAVRDPQEVEGGGEVAGLGLLDIVTEFAPTKTTRLRAVRDPLSGLTVQGYEIHHGQSWVEGQPSQELFWGRGHVTGSYLHGLLENPAYLRHFLAQVGLDVPAALPTLDERLDKLAAEVQAALDWDTLSRWAQG